MKKGGKQRKKEGREKIDPKVKDILLLLGAGAFLSASIFMPGLPIVLKPFLDAKRKREENEWKKYNTWRLKQILRRMHNQKLVEISGDIDAPTIAISEKGKRKLLHYDLENMTLKNNRWDGKWRIIIYDIFTRKKSERELFRKTLKRLNFLLLQKSVYLTPYLCYDEIEYLRQACNIGNEVLVLTVSGLENETAYKDYFGLS